MHQDAERILLEEKTIKQRVLELGEQISRDYAGKELLTVGILKGALIFLSDLVRVISVPVKMDFMATSSYGSGAHSSGEVRILKDLDQSVEGRHVLLVEDIVDTGLTLNYLAQNLIARGPASVKICALLNKPTRRVVPVAVDYVGFEIPDEFVVGYGLDYAERYRNHPDILVLRREVYGG